MRIIAQAIGRAGALAAWLALASATPVPAQAVSAGKRAPENVHRVLVVPVNVRGLSPLAIDNKQIVQALFGATRSVASQYRTISYGEVQFIGSDKDVADPVTLSKPADFCNSGLGQLAAAAEKVVAQRGVVLNAYQHFVFVLPHDAPCWWTGLGDIGGNRVWVKATTAKALQHELGHNLGMNHAVNWRGTDADSSDFMGSSSGGLNAPHIVEMGWLQPFPGKIVTLTRASDVTLETLESDPHRSTLPKVAIVQPGPSANLYYLSYRASLPDHPLPDAHTNGLNIHIADPSRHGGLTYFVASLSDNAVYSDGPMTVRQISHTKERVIFRVSFTGEGHAMPVGPPPAPAGTVQSLASGKCLDLPGGRTKDGTPTIQYDCHGGANQQWVMKSASSAGYSIVSAWSGKCIGLDPANAASGARIVQSPCNGAPGQFWMLEQDANGYVLRNAGNRLCMDVPQASSANGAELIAWACNGGLNQVWRYADPANPAAR